MENETKSPCKDAANKLVEYAEWIGATSVAMPTDGRGTSLWQVTVARVYPVVPSAAEPPRTGRPEEDQRKLRDLQATLEDVLAALGNEVPHEGPRLQAMRVRGQRDEFRQRLHVLRTALARIHSYPVRLKALVHSDREITRALQGMAKDALAAEDEVRHPPASVHLEI